MYCIFYIFISVNAMTYMGMTVYQQFMSCVQRISEVIEMEEFVFSRNADVKNKDEVCLTLKDADIGWGFRVKQESANDKIEALKKGAKKRIIQLEEVTEPTLSGLNIDMKQGNFLAVVGQVGCGKTTFL